MPKTRKKVTRAHKRALRELSASEFRAGSDLGHDAEALDQLVAMGLASRDNQSGIDAFNLTDDGEKRRRLMVGPESKTSAIER